MDIQYLIPALSLDNVQRWQKHRKDNKKTVAVHSFRATLIFRYLGGTEVDAMLTHDADEIETGDIPSPAKKHIQGLEYFKKNCVPFKAERQLGKLADLLELLCELEEDRQQYGRLPKKMQTIYTLEKAHVMGLAKELGKMKEVKELLKKIGR
jgi:5'-deoxynucleotidase YfbR-like HD superfamily hydrolase